MFIKNDSSAEHRYYNGMIGLVTAVSKDGIRVKGNGESQTFYGTKNGQIVNTA